MRVALLGLLANAPPAPMTGHNKASAHNLIIVGVVAGVILLVGLAVIFFKYGRGRR